MNPEIVIAYWPVLLSAIVFMGWLIRLEAKILYLEKDHVEQKQKTSEKDAMMWGKIDGIQVTMSSILQSLAKIEGRLENKLDHN